jgi:hypothetical protein
VGLKQPTMPVKKQPQFKQKIQALVLNLNPKQLEVLKWMQDNKEEIDTYTATKILYGNVSARKYRFPTGNFMRRLCDLDLAHWTTRDVGVRGGIVMYILTPKAKQLLKTI